MLHRWDEQMNIRKYQDSDCLEDISRVYALSWKSAYKGIVPQAYLDALPEGRWAPILARNRSRLLLALDGEKIIGVSTYAPARDITRIGWGEIISLYLLPDYYRQGTGTALLHAAEEALHTLGFADVYLWVLEDNHSARAFYEKNGFRFSGDLLTAEIGGAPLRECRYVLAERPEFEEA